MGTHACQKRMPISIIWRGFDPSQVATSNRCRVLERLLGKSRYSQRLLRLGESNGSSFRRIRIWDQPDPFGSALWNDLSMSPTQWACLSWHPHHLGIFKWSETRRAESGQLHPEIASRFASSGSEPREHPSWPVFDLSPMLPAVSIRGHQLFGTERHLVHPLLVVSISGGSSIQCPKFASDDTK